MLPTPLPPPLLLWRPSSAVAVAGRFLHAAVAVAAAGAVARGETNWCALELELVLAALPLEEADTAPS